MKRFSFLFCLLFSLAQAAPLVRPVPEVVIDPSGLSPDVLSAIQKAVEAVVKQADDQDAGEAERIRRKGHDAAISALATKGYFDANVTLEVGEDVGGDTWDISIEAGELAKVDAVNTLFTGRITKNDFAYRVDELREAWPLKVGDVFINANWNKAKTLLLDMVQEKDFFLARLMSSQAVVNPQTASVDTFTLIDSGPSVSLGEVKVIGLKVVPRSVIDRYIRYEKGMPYDQASLDEWQLQLQSTNYFRGVFLNLEVPSGEEVFYQSEVELPLLVKVTEAPTRMLNASLGLDDSVGIRTELMYRHQLIGGLPLTLETGVGADLKSQRTYMDFYLPPNHDGSVDSFGMMVRHSDIQNEEVYRVGAGWRRQRVFNLDEKSRVEFENSWALMANYDHVQRQTLSGLSKHSVPTVVGSYEIVRRDLNDKYDPRSGNLFSLGLGVGQNLRQEKAFARAALRTQWWFPMGKKDVLTLRAEVGKVWVSSTTLIPDDFGYRTGGVRSIRGYKYYGIGETVGKSVVGTRSLAVASVEYMHYFNDVLGMGVFVDVGDAARTFQQMQMKVGYGVGALVKTPAGPLQFDIAYGQKDRKIRLHFSLGIAF